MCIEHQYNFFNIYHNRRKIIVVTFKCKLLLEKKFISNELINSVTN